MVGRRTLELLLLASLIPNVACADPLYFKVYNETFPKTESYRCGVCHEGASKRHLNPYGQAVHEKLGERRSRDVDLIRRVLEALGPSPYGK